MRFQKNILLYGLCLVLIAFLITPTLPSANAQLPECTCSNSLESTCADGFRVTFLEQVNNTFRYSVCNEADNPQSDCIPPMDLSHADFIITNPGCIDDSDSNISTVIIGTDGQTMRACDAPSDKDKSCGVENLSELLIKCDNTDGIFEPGPGECVTVEITVDAQGIGIGPTIALNKAGPVCGQGCLLGPSCLECTPPNNPCNVTVEKVLNGSQGPASFDFFVDFTTSPPADFMQTLTPPNTPSFMFQIDENNQATITETMLPDGWTLNGAVCNNANFCTSDGQGGIICRCPDAGGQSATCTFTNSPPVDPPTCDIQIVKQTTPDQSQQTFVFTSTQGQAVFQLQDEGVHNINDIPLGVLTVVEETLPENWVLDSIECEGGNEGQFVIDVEDDQLVRITCDDSTDVTRVCTFNNREVPPPPVTGCCLDGDLCTDDVSAQSCSGTFDADTQCGEGDCVVDPRGCCVENNMCTESELESDCDGTFQQDGICGRGECTTIPVGCCTEGDMCNNNVLETDCSGNFEVDGTCGVECAVTPILTGCCVEDDVCTNDVDPNNCTGTFDLGQFCGQGDCVIPDAGCCFLDPGDEVALANRAVDPNKCVETTSIMCNELGGAFQGEGTMCTEFPDECNEVPPTMNVPTLSQWGLIATAGLLGIFSLLVIMRRQKYNLR